MPDESGKLTEADKTHIQEWLVKVNFPAQSGCPVCGDKSWTIADHIVQPMTMGANNAVQLGGVGYPQIMLISSKCGYTMFINAVLIGMLKPEPPEVKG